MQLRARARPAPSERTRPPLVRRRRLLGAGRRILTRIADRLPQLGDRPHDPLAPSRRAPNAARLAAAVGRAWNVIEQPVRAQRSLERAVRWGNEDALLPLGNTLLSAGSTGLDVVEHIGLTHTTTADPAAAHRVFASIDTDSPVALPAHRGMATALLREHRLQEAAAEARAHGDSDDLIAAASIAEHELAGSLTRGQLQEIIPLLERHLERHPGDTAARQRLMGIQLSLLRFDAATELADAGDASTQARDFSTWTKETAAGNHRAARRSKEHAAQRIITRRSRSTGTVSDHVARIQALNYIEGPACALDEITRRWLFAPTRIERAVRQKLHADLSLLVGDAEPLRSLSRTAPSANRTATGLFRSAVADRRVLLVGPAPSHQPDRDMIEQHDTVVTTRRPFAFPPGLERPSVMYLTNQSALTEPEEHLAWLSESERIAVLRPSMIRQHRSSLSQHSQARIQPFEDATPLFGTHFAMQRIIHDLITHGATEVTISGVDFFLGDQTHIDGYDSGSSDRFANIPFNYSHDFAYDFWFTQTLRSVGRVSAHPGVAYMLDQTLEWYLDHLPRVFL